MIRVYGILVYVDLRAACFGKMCFNVEKVIGSVGKFCVQDSTGLFCFSSLPAIFMFLVRVKGLLQRFLRKA